MLAGVLKNDIAVEVSIKIIKSFVEMRKFINANKELFEKVITMENKISLDKIGRLRYNITYKNRK